MTSLRLFIPVAAGATLFSVTLGTVLFILDFFVVNLGERFAEMVGLIPQGWTSTHLDWTINAALVITVPLVLALFVMSWKNILLVEIALQQDSLKTAD